MKVLIFTCWIMKKWNHQNFSHVPDLLSTIVDGFKLRVSGYLLGLMNWLRWQNTDEKSEVGWAFQQAATLCSKVVNTRLHAHTDLLFSDGKSQIIFVLSWVWDLVNCPENYIYLALKLKKYWTQLCNSSSFMYTHEEELLVQYRCYWHLFLVGSRIP